MAVKTITPPTGMAECPECDMGFNGFDEDGRPYTCYCCCETGWITREAREEYDKEQAKADAEYAARKPAPYPGYSRPLYLPPPCEEWTDIPF